MHKRYVGNLSDAVVYVFSRYIRFNKMTTLCLALLTILFKLSSRQALLLTAVINHVVYIALTL